MAREVAGKAAVEFWNDTVTVDLRDKTAEIINFGDEVLIAVRENGGDRCSIMIRKEEFILFLEQLKKLL